MGGFLSPALDFISVQRDERGGVTFTGDEEQELGQLARGRSVPHGPHACCQHSTGAAFAENVAMLL